MKEYSHYLDLLWIRNYRFNILNSDYDTSFEFSGEFQNYTRVFSNTSTFKVLAMVQHSNFRCLEMKQKSLKLQMKKNQEFINIQTYMTIRIKVLIKS